MEIWTNVEDYPNYLVSNRGRVKNAKTNRILKFGKHRQGYSLVWLCDSEGRHGKSVHRLVAEAFLPNPEDKDQVNHIDGNKSNNDVNNLEWSSGSENMRHAYDVLGVSCRPTVGVKIVETGEIFGSIRECANAINGSSGDICLCINGKLDSYRGLHFVRI